MLDSYGRLTLTQNWFKTGWTPFAVNRPKGTITNNGTVTGASPGFVDEAGQDYSLTSTSALRDAGVVAQPGRAARPRRGPRVREAPVERATRVIVGPIDIGAFEF